MCYTALSSAPAQRAADFCYTRPFMGTSTVALLLIGFALGVKHATDTDHVVAVATLVSQTQGTRRAARIGALWGLGHLATVFAAGTILVLLHIRMSPRVEWALEFVVALVLIALGVNTIRKCLAGRYEFHQHQHGTLAHTHLHFHAPSDAGHARRAHTGAAVSRFARLTRHGGPLLVGMAHGLAGTGGLALLVLTSIPSRAVGVLYLLVFGSGALLGMVAFSALLSVPMARAASRMAWLQAARLAVGATSCVLGAALTYRALLPAAFPF